MSQNKVNICGVNTNDLVVLSHDEMEELFQRLKNNDKKAKDILVEGNLKLVLSILNFFSNILPSIIPCFIIRSTSNYAIRLKFSTLLKIVISFLRLISSCRSSSSLSFILSNADDVI